MKTLPFAKVYQLIEPGPVVLVTTAHNGRANIMAMSWHMMVEFNPPLIACIVSEANYSFAALRATKQCVIAIPPAKLARQVVSVGNCSGRDTDKFKVPGLTPRPAKLVSPPLIAECFANLECRVVETRLVLKYNLFILEVLQAWINPPATAQKHPATLHHRGFGTFVMDGRTLCLRSEKP